MFRPTSRCLLRYSLPTVRAAYPRRLWSTAPPAQKSRTWVGSATRWALACGLVYYVQTRGILAEEPPRSASLNPNPRVLKANPSPQQYFHLPRPAMKLPYRPSNRSQPPVSLTPFHRQKARRRRTRLPIPNP